MIPQNFKQGETRDSWIGLFPLILHEHVFWVLLGVVSILGPELCQKGTLEIEQCL